MKNYFQVMRRVAEYFGRTATYGTDIQLTIMKGMQKVLTRPVKVIMGDDKIENMLLRNELSHWVHQTSKMLVNMGQAYNAILVQCTTFTRSKLKSLGVWEATLEKSDLIVLMKVIKGLIFKHDNADYVYTRWGQH